MSLSKNNNQKINEEDKKSEINNIKNSSNLFSLDKIKNKMRIYLNNTYGDKNNLKYQYIGLIMYNLIFNKNTHLVSVFKDYMIIDYIEEFLKRYYKLKESHYKLPQFSTFYKNYLKFFCSPTLNNLNANNLIHNRCEKKAEFFYNENYLNKKNNTSSSEQNNGVCEDSDSSEEEENENDNENSIKKTIENYTFFDEQIRKKIEKYTPINSSMALPESGSKLKKDDSGLLQSESNEEESLVKIAFGIGKDQIYDEPNLNKKKNKTQTFVNKKSKKKINSNIIDFILSENHSKKIFNKNNSDKKFKCEKKSKNNIDNSDSNSNKNIRTKKNSHTNNNLKKIGSQKLKILLNKNNGILKSKSNKKIIKKNGLWDLLKYRETTNIKCHDSNNTNNDLNDLYNKDNIIIVNKNINKNSNISYLSLSKNKSTKKLISKLSPNNNNINIIQNKWHSYQKNYYRNSNLTNNNSNYATYEKNDIQKKYYNNIGFPKKKIKLKNNEKNKNQIDLLLSKIKNIELNSIKRRSLNKKKILLKNQNRNRINITRNINNNKISLFGLTNNYIHSTNSKLNISNSNKNYSSNNELGTKSNKIKNLKFFNSPSSIQDFLKITKPQNKSKKNIISNQVTINKSNHIHNVNININNQINIKFNQLKDLTSFIRNSKKKKIKKGIISRNKNRSLDFHIINQNIGTNNYSSFFSNNKKKENIRMIKNNKLYGFKCKNSISRNSKLSYNIDSLNSNNKDKKIKTNYHYLFNSFKSLNNNTKV